MSNAHFVPSGGKGNVGRVTKIQGWKKDTFRSVAVVIWQGAEENNVYRRGHRGKVGMYKFGQYLL